MIELGQMAKDKVTGFEGIITGRAQYIYGCDQYCLVPSVDKQRQVVKSEWFDEGRLEIIGRGILPKEVKVKKPGGPQRDAPKTRN
jgi:hypothetical protein